MIKERILHYGGLVDKKINDLVEDALDSVCEVCEDIKENKYIDKLLSTAEKFLS